MLEENELEVLKLYPPSKICDEWQSCVNLCDIHAIDLHCEDCDAYWELVELEKKREENGQINIPLIYEYKGSSNCYLHLLFNDNDGTIQIFNDYNEFMKVVTEGRGLADFIKELADGKYA